jgi:hypothetical protein
LPVKNTNSDMAWGVGRNDDVFKRLVPPLIRKISVLL